MAKSCAYRPAIDDIAAHVGGFCGLALRLPVDAFSDLASEDSASAGGSAEASPLGSKSRGIHRTGSLESAVDTEHTHKRMKSYGSTPNLSLPGARDDRPTAHNVHYTHDGDDTEDEDEDDDHETKHRKQQDLEFELAQRMEELKTEKTAQINANNDLQKKCIALIHKEKSLQVQNASNPNSYAPGSKSGTPSNNIVQSSNDVPSEMLAEKEKQFSELLKRITEFRRKLRMQQEEFDLLAHDLQIRLDDKEYKSAEISSSFKLFKK
jgi:hypothetical protein